MDREGVEGVVAVLKKSRYRRLDTNARNIEGLSIYKLAIKKNHNTPLILYTRIPEKKRHFRAHSVEQPLYILPLLLSKPNQTSK